MASRKRIVRDENTQRVSPPAPVAWRNPDGSPVQQLYPTLDGTWCTALPELAHASLDVVNAWMLRTQRELSEALKRPPSTWPALPPPVDVGTIEQTIYGMAYWQALNALRRSARNTGALGAETRLQRHEENGVAQVREFVADVLNERRLAHLTTRVPMPSQAGVRDAVIDAALKTRWYPKELTPSQALKVQVEHPEFRDDPVRLRNTPAAVRVFITMRVVRQAIASLEENPKT
jgi:hypothetical protein